MAILGQSRERESTTEAADRYKQMKQRGREWEVVIHRRLVFFFFSQSVFSTSSKNNTKSAQQWLRRRNGSSPNPRQCWATCKASCVTWNQKKSRQTRISNTLYTAWRKPASGYRHCDYTRPICKRKPQFLASLPTLQTIFKTHLCKTAVTYSSLFTEGLILQVYVLCECADIACYSRLERR